MGQDESGTLAALKSVRSELIAPNVAEHIVRTTWIAGQPRPSGPEPPPALLFDPVLELLGALAAAPLLVVLEEVHWADTIASGNLHEPGNEAHASYKAVVTDLFFTDPGGAIIPMPPQVGDSGVIYPFQSPFASVPEPPALALFIGLMLPAVMARRRRQAR